MHPLVLIVSCVILLQDIPRERVRPEVWDTLKRCTAVEIYELYAVYKELNEEHKQYIRDKKPTKKKKS
jgi:hypothetical protein